MVLALHNASPVSIPGSAFGPLNLPRVISEKSLAQVMSTAMWGKKSNDFQYKSLLINHRRGKNITNIGT